MSQLVIFVGIPGSGKSTHYLANFAATHVHVSRDLLPPKEKKGDAKMLAMIAQALASGRDVVVDNTNPSAAARAPIIALGRQFGARLIAYYFDCAPRIAVARNAKREGKAKVPKAAIHATAKKLQPPHVNEGFDEVHVITCS